MPNSTPCGTSRQSTVPPCWQRSSASSRVRFSILAKLWCPYDARRAASARARRSSARRARAPARDLSTYSRRGTLYVSACTRYFFSGPCKFTSNV